MIVRAGLFIGQLPFELGLQLINMWREILNPEEILKRCH
jgi:hypothetical protein